MNSANSSDIVRSMVGRDSGLLFFVLEAEGEYVALVDGKKRKLCKPKRKKQKHIELISKGDDQYAEALRRATDKEIRKALAIFSRSRDKQSREGNKLGKR